MKIIHTADWHLGHLLYHYERSAEHAHFLKWLLLTIRNERPDALLVAGDIFDNFYPDAAAEKLLGDFLDQLMQENPKLRVILTTGNHDSAPKLDAMTSLFRRIGVQVRGHLPHNEKGKVLYDELFIPIDNHTGEEQAIILALPYLSGDENIEDILEKAVKVATKKWPGLPLVIMGHFFAEGAIEELCKSHGFPLIEGLSGISLEKITRKVTYVALGHVHKPIAVSKNQNSWYSGSPLPLSFAEKSDSHGVNLVEIQPEKATTIRFLEYQPLCPLLTIPQAGIANLESALNMLKEFPLRDKAEHTHPYPYVEVQIQEKNADPAMLRTILEEANKRCIRLCAVKRVTSDGKIPDKSIYEDNYSVATLPNAAQVAREIYKTHFNEDMSDESAQLLALAKRECDKLY